MPERASRRAPEPSKAVLGHPGACQRRPGGAPGTSEEPLKPPRRLQAPPKECPRAPQGAKGRDRSAPGSLALAVLGHRRATGFVSGAFAEIVVLQSKKLGFGDLGGLRIIAGGTGQCRCRPFWGLASSVWGLWIQIRSFAVGCGPAGARPGAATSAQGRYGARFRTLTPGPVREFLHR